MALSSLLQKYYKIINKTTSAPTTESADGIYFVNAENYSGLWIVSSFGGTKRLIKIYNSSDWYDRTTIDEKISTIDNTANENFETLDNKIDENYNTLDDKINQNYQTLDEKIIASNADFLGGVKHNDLEPTPGKSGKYEFTSAGTCAWITSGSVTVAIGDAVLVMYDSENETYTYELVENTSEFVRTLNVTGEFGDDETKVVNQKKVTEVTTIDDYAELATDETEVVTKALLTNGTTQSSAFYNAKLLIPINPKNKYYQWGRYVSWPGYLRIAFYNSLGVFISGQSNSQEQNVAVIYSGEEIENIPANAAFMSICGVPYNINQPTWTLGIKYSVWSNETVKSVVEDLRDKESFFDYTTGKNRLIPETVTDGKYISSSAGATSANSNTFISDFIEWGTENVIRFKTYEGNNRVTAYILQYDADKNPIAESYVDTPVYFVAKHEDAVYVKVTCFVFGDSTFKDPLKWMLYFGNDTTVAFENYYNKKVYKRDIYGNEVLFNPDMRTVTPLVTTTVKTVKRLGTSGVDADFCGLNALGDCLASITDASATNRYKIIAEGDFDFTATADFVYKDAYNEWSVLVSKKWVDVEGISKEKFRISVQLPDNLAINYGTYQPVMWNYGSLSNFTIVAKNCRYGLHIEGATAGDNTECNISNFDIVHLGNYNNAAVSQSGSTAWTGTNAIGAGIRDGQIVNIKSGRVKSVQTGDIQFHSPLTQCFKDYTLNIENIVFSGVQPFGVNLYPTQQRFKVNLINPEFNGKRKLGIGNYVSTWGGGNTACYNDIDIFIDSDPLAYYLNPTQSSGLRIVSKSTGVNSIVTVDKDCTAFGIIGKANDTIETETKWLTKKRYGYEYRNGAVGVSGFIIGHADINESTSYTSLGKILGDCSSVNKTLTLTVDGTTYNVVFNQNCTSLTNTQVIALITAVIGSVATVDVYKVGIDMYPDFKNISKVTNGESTDVIYAGMGVVRNGSGTVRKALNADGYIDGIAIDTAGVGQTLRMIEKGEIYNYSLGYRFTTLETTSATRNAGAKMGISSSDPGKFELNATPTLLRATDTYILKIL